MAFDAYQCLRIRLDRGVCFATIDQHPRYQAWLATQSSARR